MIVLDTHAWMWWADGNPRLTAAHRRAIEAEPSDEVGVSAISPWEVALLVARGRLTLRAPVEEWIMNALDHPRTRLLELTPRIAVEATHLPGDFHRDPADQIIVATARVHDSRLDAAILRSAGAAETKPDAAQHTDARAAAEAQPDARATTRLPFTSLYARAHARAISRRPARSRG